MDYTLITLWLLVGIYFPIGMAIGVVIFLQNFETIKAAEISFGWFLVEMFKLIAGCTFYGLFWPITVYKLIRRIK